MRNVNAVKTALGPPVPCAGVKYVKCEKLKPKKLCAYLTIRSQWLVGVLLASLELARHPWRIVSVQ